MRESMTLLITNPNPTKREILALLRNEALAIRVPEFLDKLEIERILRNIHRVGIEFYSGDTKAGTIERKGKIGPNLFRFKDDLDTYFTKVSHYEKNERPLIFSRTDISIKFKTLIQKRLSCHVDRTKFAEKYLADCTVRALPGAPVHTDWIVRELPSFEAFDYLIDQFAWNVYLSVGESGGQTKIYDTTNPDTIELPQIRVSEITPCVGDLILFRSRNSHTVSPVSGERLTVSGFWGPTVSGGIQYWV